MLCIRLVHSVNTKFSIFTQRETEWRVTLNEFYNNGINRKLRLFLNFFLVLGWITKTKVTSGYRMTRNLAQVHALWHGPVSQCLCVDGLRIRKDEDRGRKCHSTTTMMSRTKETRQWDKGTSGDVARSDGVRDGTRNKRRKDDAC